MSAFSHDSFDAYKQFVLTKCAPLVGVACSILEVGSYEGESLTWFAETIATHASATVKSIDDGIDRPALWPGVDLSQALSNNVTASAAAAKVTVATADPRTQLFLETAASYDVVHLRWGTEVRDWFALAIGAWRALNSTSRLFIDVRGDGSIVNSPTLDAARRAEIEAAVAELEAWTGRTAIWSRSYVYLTKP